MKDFNGKWALITGAASGIGRALAHELARAGANIIIADVDQEGMQAAAEEIGDGGKALCLKCDLTRPAEVEALARDALDSAGRVDVLINNAGIAHVCEAKDLSIEEWDRITAVNLRAPILLTHHLLGHMIERGSGHIVNLASMAGLIPIPGMAPYTTTKFGLVGFSEALRVELRPFGIGVTVVCPGVVATPIIQTSTIKGFSDQLRDPPAVITISPERAAKIILRAVRKNRARVIPAALAARALWVLKSNLPQPLSELIISKLYASWERTPI